MKNWIQENWFKASIILIGLLVAISLISIAGNYKSAPNITKDDSKKSDTIRFYIKSAVANVRECPSTDCKVLIQYSQNSWWDFPITSNYHTVNGMPEWVYIGWSDEKGNSGNGYINKSNFSDTPIVVNQTQTQQSYSSKQDLVSIIKRWRPLIAYIECDFKYTTGETYLVQSGSGILSGYIDSSGDFIFTNKHVLTDSEGYTPDSCVVRLPDHNKVFNIPSGQGLFYRSKDYDFATIKIPNPDDYVISLVNSVKHSLFCGEGRPPLGSSIIILGYPGIGSKVDITATEGIISGYDNNYYITSAKIEHGNSGGAAVLIGYKDSCILGVPTFAITGTVESLARILSWESILNLR